MGALIDYWYYTGDDKWNDVITQGLLFQVGPNQDYMPPNQTMTEGNDDQVSIRSPTVPLSGPPDVDQGFWGMAVLSAAEYNFPNPPASQSQWIALAQAVFNTQAARWDTANCNGGLRWQIFQWNNGFDYKNSISQACFFNIAARLALYTRNETYADWADRVWDWMTESRFMTEDSYYIYDGAHIEANCTSITPYQWTYNAGAFLLGAAAMYNYSVYRDHSASQMWHERVDGVLNGTHVFFIGNDKNIMSEVACESVHLCDNDQQSFKAYLARWMAATTKWAPWTYDTVKPLLAASATAAAQQCTGGDNGRMCGLMWANNSGQWDGTTGVGQQMAAMEVVLANMIKDLDPPVTNSTGGTSVGNPSAGTGNIGSTNGYKALATMKPITNADRAGGWTLTVFAMVFLIMGMRFVFRDETNDMTWNERGDEFRADIGPGGILGPGGGRYAGKHDASQTKSEKSTRAPNTDGPATPPRQILRRKRVSAGPVSAYKDEGARPSWTVSRGDDYPNEQPWRRWAREGDFAGAFDPHRGNGAGFGIMDVATPPQAAAALSSSSLAGSSRTGCEARELTTKTKQLQWERKPLPGKPGLGSRQQAHDVSDRKV